MFLLNEKRTLFHLYVLIIAGIECCVKHDDTLLVPKDVYQPAVKFMVKNFQEFPKFNLNINGKEFKLYQDLLVPNCYELKD